MTVGRSDQYRVTLWIDDQLIGIFDDKDGGGLDSQELKYRPGGGQTQVSLGGPTMVDNITLTRGFDRARDAGLRKWMFTRVGKGRAVSSVQPLDIDNHPEGDPDVYQGVFKKFTPSKVQSDANTVDTYDIEVSTDGTIG